MRDAYLARIHRVIDHVQEHLSEDLSLEQLARVAAFSPFHFHRVFRALTGETVAAFVRRVRLERGASHLLWHPGRPVTEVALDAGFASPAAFTRAFQRRFGMSPSAWRARGLAHAEQDRKDGQADGKGGNAPGRVERYQEPGAWAPRWRLVMNETRTDVNVEVQTLPEQTVAYVRHTGPYQGDAALFGRLFGELAQWAGPRGLLGPGAQFLSLYHDDPNVTDEEKLRVTCAVTVPPDTAVEGKIGKTTIPGGAYAVGHFTLHAADYTAAWQAMYGGWLPGSGYQPDDRPALERYLNDPERDPEGKHVVDICIPVKPL